MISFTEDQAVALVTDAGTLKRGRELAAPAKWANLGRTDAAAWGECAGSGSKPYLVGIDLTEPAFKCSCPSRVFPCKHGAGLLLLLARQPALLPAGAPPAWLAEWLDKRQAKSTAQAEKAPAIAAPAATDAAAPAEAASGPTPAQRKREAQRHARMQAGAEELETWLLDVLRAGLAELPKQKRAFWENPAARLVDNQLPGLAATLRELAELPTAGPAWAERLLGRLGELYVLLRAFRRREALGPAAQQEVGQQVGLTPKKDELLARPDALLVADTWLVLGQYAWEEERLLVRRSWLYGQRSGRTALVLDFAFGNQPFATALVPQGKYAGELVFYPGLLPLRAAPVGLTYQDSGAEAIPPGQTISQLLGTYAAALARQPWLRQWPAALGPARLYPLPDGRWLLHHATEPLTVPLRIADEEIAWQWLAFGGGQPLTFFGEWDGAAFCPLVCWREDVDAAGNALVLDDFFVAGGSGQPVGALAALVPPAASPGRASVPAPAVPAAAEAPAWPPLLRLALLGTRQSAEVPPVLAGLPVAAAREQQLLLTAGTLALLQKAGYKPAAATAPALAPAPPDALPPLGPLGAECLHRMVVAAQHLDLLPDYLRRAAAAGRRVPEMLLMPLLQHATTSVAARADLGAVLGERGRWLAALNPAWAKLVTFSAATADPADATAWETGRPAERLAWLRQRFAHDADAARPLLLAALPTEPAKMQEELLHLLAEHLHPAAEPVLESLLKARGQEVRRQAAALLVRLPGAALTERLWARAAPLITAKRKLLGLGDATLEITLPTAWDKSWLADGIEEQNSSYVFAALDANAQKAVGPAAARLGNLLALLPPGRWTAHLKLTASELLTAALASEWPVPLLLPWAQSTLLHQDVDFAAAFLRLWMHQRLALTKAQCIRGINWVALAELLPAADRQEALYKPVLLRVRRQEPDWLADLGYVPAPWLRLLTEAVLEAISGQLANTAQLRDNNTPFYQLRQLVGQLPHAIAPNVALPEVDWVIQRVQAIEQPHPTFLPHLHTFMDTLRFRAELEASLREE